MIDTSRLVVFTGILVIFAAGLVWLLTAIGIHSPVNYLATATASIAVAINL